MHPVVKFLKANVSTPAEIDEIKSALEGAECHRSCLVVSDFHEQLFHLYNEHPIHRRQYRSIQPNLLPVEFFSEVRLWIYNLIFEARKLVLDDDFFSEVEKKLCIELGFADRLSMIFAYVYRFICIVRSQVPILEKSSDPLHKFVDKLKQKSGSKHAATKTRGVRSSMDDGVFNAVKADFQKQIKNLFFSLYKYLQVLLCVFLERHVFFLINNLKLNGVAYQFDDEFERLLGRLVVTDHGRDKLVFSKLDRCSSVIDVGNALTVSLLRVLKQNRKPIYAEFDGFLKGSHLFMGLIKETMSIPYIFYDVFSQAFSKVQSDVSTLRNYLYDLDAFWDICYREQPLKFLEKQVEAMSAEIIKMRDNYYPMLNLSPLSIRVQYNPVQDYIYSLQSMIQAEAQHSLTTAQFYQIAWLEHLLGTLVNALEQAVDKGGENYVFNSVFNELDKHYRPLDKEHRGILRMFSKPNLPALDFPSQLKQARQVVHSLSSSSS